MKKQWQEVQTRILADDVGKQDFVLPLKDIKLTRGTVTSVTDMDFPYLSPDDHALGQLSSRVGIPVRYARKCMESNKSMLDSHFNYWINKLDEDTEGAKSWLLRAKRDTLRGVLTDKYSQLDNEFVFDALGVALQKGEIVDVKNFDLTSKLLNFRVVFPDLTMNIGTLQKPDNVMVGIHIVNSEVGASSLRIESCLFRQVCTNGLVVKVGDGALMQQRHVHLTTKEMENRVVDAIDKALQAGDSLIDKFARTRDIKVANPISRLEKLAKNQKYSNKFTDTLKNSFNSEPGDTAFHIINAFTHASQTLPFENRLEVETFAGNVMESFLNNKERWDV